MYIPSKTHYVSPLFTVYQASQDGTFVQKCTAPSWLAFAASRHYERDFYKSPNEKSTNHRTKSLQITERKFCKSPNILENALIISACLCFLTTKNDEDINGYRQLIAYRFRIDTGKMKAPAFLMVLTAVGDYAFQREDGVYVVPIGSLKP